MGRPQPQTRTKYVIVHIPATGLVIGPVTLYADGTVVVGDTIYRGRTPISCQVSAHRLHRSSDRKSPLVIKGPGRRRHVLRYSPILQCWLRKMTVHGTYTASHYMFWLRQSGPFIALFTWVILKSPELALAMVLTLLLYGPQLLRAILRSMSISVFELDDTTTPESDAHQLP
jgi:hypothetical protein